MDSRGERRERRWARLAMALVATATVAVFSLPAASAAHPAAAMPSPAENFVGLGTTQGGCIFPKPGGGEPAGCVANGIPPDTVGAAGPNDYVELVNGGIGIFDKNGTLRQTPVYLNTIWTGYPTTDGNNCAAGNWGDPIVRYDQLADRWLVSEFDITNDVASGTGPSYECVAVSKTGDPTGAWNLYDFKYNAALDDYPKFGVWPDGYYVTYNEFSSTPTFIDSRICALDRTAMLAGQPATQICRTGPYGLLPANVDGPVPPPSGSPEYVVALGTNKIELFKFHVDWATPANSTLSAATNLTTQSFTQACGGTACIPQPSPGNQLDSLGDRFMDRLVYRNFGTHESLLLTHSVTAGAVASGIRWYEVRDPGGTPSIYQQGTYAPDTSSRWMGSIAMDQAGDIAVGYSLSSSSIKPSIAWAGRIPTDPLGTLGQGEAVVQSGAGVETGTLSDGSTADRWGDYSSMTVDPSDDCTFWYANEYYPANGIFNWDTRIASFKFPRCAANDFSATASPSGVAVGQGSTAQSTLSTTVTNGTGETVTLTAQDLPAGVTASFDPATVTAGQSSAVTVTAAADAPLGTVTAGIIETADSAVHYTPLDVTVALPETLTVSRAGAGTGSVTSAPAAIDCGATCAHDFAQGVDVTLTATPDAGSSFSGWTGDIGGCTPSAATCQVTMDQPRSVTATFVVNPTLTVKKAGSGSGTVSSPSGIDCGTTCASDFPPGTQVTLTAAARAGSRFTGWSGGRCSGTSPCHVTLDADTTVTATFAKQCIVPNVKGKPLARAKRAIKAAHCAVGKIGHSTSRKVRKGDVISQSPHAGKRLKENAKVNLVVSKGR